MKTIKAQYDLTRYESLKDAIGSIKIPEKYRWQITDGVCKIYEENKEKAAITLSEFQEDINRYRFGNIVKAVQKSIDSLMREHLGYDNCCPQPRHVLDS